MKNIFKLMGLALIAGSMMFVACSKDEDNDKIQVTYGEESWSTNDMYVMVYGQEMNATIYASESDDDPSITFSCGTTANRYALTSTYLVSYDKGDGIEHLSTTEGAITISEIELSNQTMSANIDCMILDGTEQVPLTVAIDNITWKTPSVQ